MSKIHLLAILLLTSSFSGCLGIENLLTDEGPEIIPENEIDNGGTKPTDPILGCTNATADNFNPNATVDDDSCFLNL